MADPTDSTWDWKTGVLANLLITGVLGYMAVLHKWAPDFYYMSVQEDEYIEWSTYCAFAFAAAAWLLATWRGRGWGRRLPWFTAGLALFCLFVAGEEISWGQRLLAYRPPAYFLEHNFQQELNVHNVISTDLRKLSLRTIIGGYGIVLPLLAAIPPIGLLLRRLGIHVPTPWLIPSFAAALAAYVEYPWKYTGETVELMVGLCFLFASLHHLRKTNAVPAGFRRQPWVSVTIAWALVMALGATNAAAARVHRSEDPARIEAAKIELEALRRDFLWMASGRSKVFSLSHSLHKRVYTYEQEHGAHRLLRGEFADLVSRGLPEERAEFFLDPWNLPYWINIRSSQRIAFLYSFGPNRRRDSSYTEIRGDDVGVFIVGPQTD
ncbi:MAG: hypothetical protein D6815_11920 [Candidatus Dadabacteria bacterium]|nr:MAG: hypothetical protein D6815_11920 [Candidatus Dadabacteria bacterium]